MRLITPPTEYDSFDGLFLAGGISNCSDWQSGMVSLLADTELTIINPRRPDYKDDPDAVYQQITWEYRHLLRSKAISFWFPSETLCPITLLEFGRWTATSKPVFVGCHPEYKRRLDLEIQLKLIRPFDRIVYSVEELAETVRCGLGLK